MSRKRNPLVDPDKLGGRMIIAEQRLQAHARRDHALDARITSLSIRLAAVERQNAPEQAETAPGDFKMFEESFEGVKPVEDTVIDVPGGGQLHIPASLRPTGDPDLVKQVMGFYQTRPVRDSMPTYTAPRGGVEILPPVTRGSPKPELWRLIERQRIELTRLNKRAARHKRWRKKHQERMELLHRAERTADAAVDRWRAAVVQAADERDQAEATAKDLRRAAADLLTKVHKLEARMAGEDV